MFSGLVNNVMALSICLLLITCGPTTVEQNKPEDNKKNEALIAANKYLVKQDEENIKSYCKRYKWNMTITGTGLWYEIVEHGNGIKASEGKQVTLKYRTELLDGTYCYSSDSTGYKIFTLGSGKVESGLDEGVSLMRVGDKARFIIPPHLAYGLLGDNSCIPSRSVIVYKVELVKVENVTKH